ncbi:MAG: hypothetical protein JJE04_01365, partial [Acidobacteriia bacterium]|nr:hypothetical protein [Terriglobia bacterium]
PQRAWPAMLMASFLLLGLGLSGLFFVALQYASSAGWSVAFRRVPEAMTAALPFGALGLAVVFLIHPALYPWTGEGGHHLPGFKGVWLSLPFFLVRAAVYVSLWIGFAALIVRGSRRQDEDGSVQHTRRNIRYSVLFLPVFAITFWLASTDWIMSLEPHWYSTIFGVYNFAGLFSSGLAMMILLILWLRARGPLTDFVNEEHLHDLGKLLFAFSTFWMYIWFSQYMLIWYANIPEETTYYIQRTQGFWLPLFLLNMLLNWAIPFAVLMPRPPKRNPVVLARVAVVVLLGRCLDLYLMVAPAVSNEGPAFGLLEASMFAGAIAVFLLVFIRWMRQAPPVPVQDPFLSESLHYHN